MRKIRKISVDNIDEYFCLVRTLLTASEIHAVLISKPVEFHVDVVKRILLVYCGFFLVCCKENITYIRITELVYIIKLPKDANYSLLRNSKSYSILWNAFILLLFITVYRRVWIYVYVK